ncbi:hypothetical protein CR513_04854 [Mucuna pruriens]|uniref:Uncharacterized protein n=1 Tax=Mucuna pruriens TaxID=157652 RepID=A0A371I6C4_MUCPR|nr:hypothetical protein CR513_04854 [Mucuna pruriens]
MVPTLPSTLHLLPNYKHYAHKTVALQTEWR